MKIFKKDNISIAVVHDSVTDYFHVFYVVNGKSFSPIYTRDEFELRFGKDITYEDAKYTLTTEELKTFSTIKVVSSGGYSFETPADTVTEIKILHSGGVMITNKQGDIRYYSRSDVIIRK